MVLEGIPGGPQQNDVTNFIHQKSPNFDRIYDSLLKSCITLIITISSVTKSDND